MQTNSFSTQNPQNLQTLKTYSYLNSTEIIQALEECWHNYLQWKNISIAKRSSTLRNISKTMQERSVLLAECMHQEMGKPISEALLEIQKSCEALIYFADHAEEILQTQNISAHYAKTEIQFSPLGPVLAIMPWNYPVWQVVRFAAPALMAGNTIILKHSEITAGTAFLLEEIFNSEMPILKNIYVRHDQVEMLIADSRVRGVTLTGSTFAGRAVAALSGRYLKKTILELGGNDAYLVFADTDLKKAAAVCVSKRLMNAGQSCIAAKRFLIEKSIYEEFLKVLVEELALAPKTLLLAHHRFQQQLKHQVEKLQSQAHLVWGGDFSDLQGAEFPVTVFRDVNFNNFDEELFGPVFCLMSFETDEQALAIVNSSQFGLGASLMTENLERIQYFKKHLDVGMIAVNSSVASDSRTPFGGVKCSGFGREASHFGLLEFVNIQTIGLG